MTKIEQLRNRYRFSPVQADGDVLSILDLVEMQHEALMAMISYARADHKGLKIADDSLTAFEEWNKP